MKTNICSLITDTLYAKMPSGFIQGNWNPISCFNLGDQLWFVLENTENYEKKWFPVIDTLSLSKNSDILEQLRSSNIIFNKKDYYENKRACVELLKFLSSD